MNCDPTFFHYRPCSRRVGHFADLDYPEVPGYQSHREVSLRLCWQHLRLLRGYVDEMHRIAPSMAPTLERTGTTMRDGTPLSVSWTREDAARQERFHAVQAAVLAKNRVGLGTLLTPNGEAIKREVERVNAEWEAGDTDRAGGRG